MNVFSRFYNRFILSAVACLCSLDVLASTWVFRGGGYLPEIQPNHEISMAKNLARCQNYKNKTCVVVEKQNPNYSTYWIYYTAGPTPPSGGCEGSACSAPNNNTSCPASKNPIVYSNGKKYLIERDLLAAGISKLDFTRFYNYLPGNEPVEHFKELWRIGSVEDQSLSLIPLPNDGADVSYFEDDGYIISTLYEASRSYFYFRKNNQTYKVYVSDDPDVGTVIEDTKLQGTFSLKIDELYGGQVVEYFGIDGELIKFDAVNGRLIAKQWPNGYSQTIEYLNGIIAPYSYRIEDSLGKVITFEYLTDTHAVLTDTGGLQYHYLFDSHTPIGGNPSLKVLYPDNTPEDLSDNPYREYVHQSRFDEQGEPLPGNGALLQVIENGVTQLTYTYDANGYPIHSHEGEGSDREGSVDIAYTFNTEDRVSKASVINALGKTTHYHFESHGGAQQVVHVEGESSSNCVASDSYYTYDDNGYVETFTDNEGAVTEYSRDELGRETQRIEAKGTPEERTIQTGWHSSRNLRTQILEPERETTFAYDQQGNLLNTTVAPRTTP